MDASTADKQATQTSPPYPTQPGQLPQRPYPVQPQAALDSPPQYPTQPPTASYTQKTHTAVVVTKPPRTNEPCPHRNLIPISAINSFLCCFLFGFVAIYYSRKANFSWAQGYHEEANSYATKAKIWNVVTTLTGIVVLGGVIALFVLEVLTTSLSST